MSEFEADLYENDYPVHSFLIDDEVISYINNRDTDFRISTACSGPVLLPVSYKPAKPGDIALKAGKHTIFISMYQARYIDRIHMGLIPYHLSCNYSDRKDLE